MVGDGKPYLEQMLQPQAEISRVVEHRIHAWFGRCLSTVGSLPDATELSWILIIGNYCPDGKDYLDPNGSGRLPMTESLSRSFNGGGPHFFLWKKPGGEKTPFVQFEKLDPDFTGGGTYCFILQPFGLKLEPLAVGDHFFTV